ncbi:hypothetical protein CK203_024941 [Vitis vinifera]|uniref:Uncharacterized protein n=1 Tax=Vitis vinifera TaxID=29760 RepID=A0A438J730_VITVI|nr:hypothetical protein CK203_024941 [Vitis vinifera]
MKGENFIKEDKDQDSCVIDSFLIDPSKVFDPVSIPLINRIDLHKVFDPVSVPSSELESPELSIEPALEN